MNNSHNKIALKGLGHLIRTERKSHGLSQGELGYLSGASLNFISQLELGKETVQLSKVLDILTALGLQFSVELGKKRIEIKVSQK